VREESGEIVTVNDTMLDLRTGQASAGRMAPYVPIGPVAVAIPVTIGGESRRDVPGEELTVRLLGGRLIVIVQERASPAFGKGERVRVLYEKENPISGQARIRVERETQ
jgi:outer membrane lipoprotein SlyB